MLKQGLNQKLLQKLSPQQIQFIQLLQLNSAEFEQRLEEELDENPALEEAENTEEEPTEQELAYEDNNSEEEEAYSEDAFEEAVQVEESLEDTEAKVEQGNEAEPYAELEIGDYLPNDDDQQQDQMPPDPNEEEKEIPITNSQSLYEALEQQFNAMDLNEREVMLGKHLIGMLEEDGYLRRPLKNVAYDLKFLNNIDTSEAELEGLLHIIQQFEPAGVGARDLQECMLIQLSKKEQTPDVQLAERIVRNHMRELANKHYGKLTQSLKIDRERLRDVLEVITHLNPKPGEALSTGKAQYVTPDFVVTNVNGDLQVSLNNKNTPSLKINQGYQETLKGFKETKQKDKNLKEQVQYIKQKLDSAKWFIDAVKQRQQTLLLTMQTIVSFQRDFFLSGDFSQLKPMVLKDIADRIDMDISTISRVVNSKYVETDFGIYSLKEFFSEGIQTSRGEEVSNREVKQILEDMVNNEDKQKPLTDEKLTQILNDKGYNVARRTVAKYREQLGIQVARLRKAL